MRSRFWDHVAMTPGLPPQVGTSNVMKGKHAAPKWPGYSKTIHYEITGAGRIDYQFNPAATEDTRGVPHGVVKILTIDPRQPLTGHPRAPSLSQPVHLLGEHQLPCHAARVRNGTGSIGLPQMGMGKHCMRQLRTATRGAAGNYALSHALT
jgi:hypothetical protein